jgi:hypothetical protein
MLALVQSWRGEAKFPDAADGTSCFKLSYNVWAFQSVAYDTHCHVLQLAVLGTCDWGRLASTDDLPTSDLSSHSPTSRNVLEMLVLGKKMVIKKSKAVPLHALEALGGRGGIAPTHS